MLRQAIAFFGFVALVACSNPSVEIASNGPAPVVLYEGARLIAGDGSAPLVDSAFLVESGTITGVGRKGERDRARRRGAASTSPAKRSCPP